jgi:hypothetical protein
VINSGALRSFLHEKCAITMGMAREYDVKAAQVTGESLVTQEAGHARSRPSTRW